MRDPDVAGRQMLLVGRMFERDGDAVRAALAYREVVLAGDASSAGEARMRLELLARRALPDRPA